MTMYIDDEDTCEICGAYWNSNGHCSNGHPATLSNEFKEQINGFGV